MHPLLAGWAWWANHAKSIPNPETGRFGDALALAPRAGECALNPPAQGVRTVRLARGAHLPNTKMPKPKYKLFGSDKSAQKRAFLVKKERILLFFENGFFKFFVGCLEADFFVCL